MNLSERLVFLRKSRGVTQRQLAAAINISEIAVQNYESGRRSPVPAVLLALANFFNVPVDFFLARPPFEDWVGVLKCRSIILETTAATFGLDAEWLQSLSEPEFIRIFGALYAKVTVHPEENAVDLYPLIPPEHFQRR